jgi:hypothetical protein
VILDLCENAELSVSIPGNKVFLSAAPTLFLRPRILDITAVLKAGITQHDIEAAIYTLQKQNPQYLERPSQPGMGCVLRNRLFTAMDDSAYRFVIEMLDEARKTGKLPPLKVPWFYKTFKKEDVSDEKK